MTQPIRIGTVFHYEGAGKLYPVAFVRCMSTHHTGALEECFELTNSIDRPWTHNKQVIPTRLNAGVPRSTSVGDYIQLDKCMYRCDANGWTHVNTTWFDVISALVTRRNWRKM